MTAFDVTRLFYRLSIRSVSRHDIVLVVVSIVSAQIFPFPFDSHRTHQCFSTVTMNFVSDGKRVFFFLHPDESIER